TASPLTGSFAIITAFLWIGSVQLMTIGIMGEYIGRIYDEVKGRPHFIVKEAGLKESSAAYVPISGRSQLADELCGTDCLNGERFHRLEKSKNVLGKVGYEYENSKSAGCCYYPVLGRRLCGRLYRPRGNGNAQPQLFQSRQ